MDSLEVQNGYHSYGDLSFHDFCSSKGWVAKDRTVITHTTLDGHMYNVPPEGTRSFLTRYAWSLMMGDKLFIVEYRTQPFRFFLDLDFSDPEPEPWKFTDDKFQELVQLLQNEVRQCFPQANLQLIVTSGPLKYEGESVKSCFHLYWPQLWIADSTALGLRFLMVQKLMETWERNKPCNTWEEAVDVAVLMQNGLRMFGSFKKTQKCPGCDGRGGARCPRKERCTRGFVTETARPYVLDAICSESLEVIQPDTQHFREVTTRLEDPEELYRFMELVTIRSRPGQRTLEPIFPPNMPPLVLEPPRRRKAPLSTKAMQVRSLTGRMIHVDVDNAWFEVPTSILESIMVKIQTWECWKLVRLTRVTYATNRKMCKFYVSGRGCGWCMNKGDGSSGANHTGQNIYFVIPSNVPIIEQKCFSTNTKNPRVSVTPCHPTFSFRVGVLDTPLHQALFPSMDSSRDIPEGTEEEFCRLSLNQMERTPRGEGSNVTLRHPADSRNQFRGHYIPLWDKLMLLTTPRHISLRDVMVRSIDERLKRPMPMIQLGSSKRKRKNAPQEEEQEETFDEEMY